MLQAGACGSSDPLVGDLQVYCLEPTDQRAAVGWTPEDGSKDLEPLPEVGTHSLDEMWSNVTYFLKAVVPAAEAAGVRLALHPNDPPVPLSRGSGQIMATLAGWKRLVGIVDSPANGITFDCGVTRELGEDPAAVCRYFGERDRINHVHYRNVRVRTPYTQYTEVFPDEGDVDMVAALKVLVEVGYRYMVMPDHVPSLDADPDHAVAFSYCFGYIRALLQVIAESHPGAVEL